MTIKRVLHLFLIIGANILFFSSHFYCDYKCFNTLNPSNELVEKIGTDKWWTIRCNLYAIIFFEIIVSSYFPKHKYSYFWMFFLLGLCISDIVDRMYFDINKFTTEDISMIVVNFVMSLTFTKIRKCL